MNPQENYFKTLVELLVIDLGYTLIRYTYPAFGTGETVYAVKILRNGRPVTSPMDVPQETWESLELLEDTQIDQNVPACANGRPVCLPKAGTGRRQTGNAQAGRWEYLL